MRNALWISLNCTDEFHNWDVLVFNVRLLLVYVVLSLFMPITDSVDVRNRKRDFLFFLVYSVPLALFCLKLVYYGFVMVVLNQPTVIPHDSCWLPNIKPCPSELPFIGDWFPVCKKQSLCMVYPGIPLLNELLVIPYFITGRGIHTALLGIEKHSEALYRSFMERHTKVE
jgi:hypothetical protein